MLSRPSGHILTIDSQVPFDVEIAAWQQIHGIRLGSLIHESRRFEPAYLAWETVRRSRNPFFLRGTGFEGYFVGLCHSPEEALERILNTSKDILAGIIRYHHHNYLYQSRLMKALTEDNTDAQVIAEWSAILGATLARLRTYVRRSPKAGSFHESTYKIVSQLPPMTYVPKVCPVEQSPRIEQIYHVGRGGDLPGARLEISLNSLKPADQDAWLVAAFIGKFGHPLVREFLRQANRRG